MFVFIKRIIKNGWRNFIRNPLLSLAASLINSLMVITIVGLIVFYNFSSNLIKYVQQKLDLSVYFKENTTESQIKSLQSELSTFDFVEKIEYITKDEALNIFKQKNKNNPLIIDALEELGQNPLTASLAITTKQPEDYQKLTEFLENSKYRNIIEEITFSKNKEIIDRIVQLTNQSKNILLFVIFAFAVIAAIVVFNTIRIITFSQKREIEIMTLIGSSKSFIKLPYILTSTFYGIFGIILSLITLSIILPFIAPFFDKIISNFSIKEYILNNILFLTLIGFLFSVGINNIATWIALNKYLKLK
jgi:cell division transport system permease protein